MPRCRAVKYSRLWNFIYANLKCLVFSFVYLLFPKDHLVTYLDVFLFDRDGAQIYQRCQEGRRPFARMAFCQNSHLLY